jgi:hypothetical protein
MRLLLIFPVSYSDLPQQNLPTRALVQAPAVMMVGWG